MRPASLIPSAAVLLQVLTATAFAATAEAPHVRVDYTGIDANQATAIARTLSAAREAYVTQFGFDMPESIVCTVTCGDGQPTRLYTDGNDRVFLSLPSKDKLAQPRKSRVNNLYGLCHELGHVGMYRLLRDRDWMTGPAAEGWAHFAGSGVVDEVYKAEGEKLWPDPYDYRADGTRRLAAQLKDAKPSDIAQGAGKWQELEGIIGRQGFAPLFTAWQAAKVDPAKPEGLKDELVKLLPDKKDSIERWWKAAAQVLVERREASGFAKAELAADKLSGKPVTLAGDDGAADGKKSMAGTGHARAFDVPGEGEWYVTAVSVYGARYGPAAAPATDFDVVLCDAELKPIATWKKPYSAFARGNMGWVRLAVPPTRVPKGFVVCLSFRPTATGGVFVGYDAGTTGHSSVALPGKPGDPFKDGDWMVRVELDRPKAADALR